LRIISGKYRSKTLHPPKNFKARPTTDFAKAGLFNILNNYLDYEGVRVLDLFSGTGSISFEFASRGCTSIDAVESDHLHADYIRRTAKELGFEGFRAIKSDAFVFIRHAKSSYDLVFCDPPYEMEGIEYLPAAILEAGLVAPKGWLIFEHSAKYRFDQVESFAEERHYGSVHFSFFRP
jgi:16S rRNA (guanine966-N2)-methyltransferase